MKYIAKDLKNDPISLIEHRSTPGATFDDCNKAAIRMALLLEQGYICAYCMRRIDNGISKKGQPNTRIEHFEAQSNREDLRMNYLNMLGVCDGNEGNPKHLLTCDKRRTNQLLTIDPRKENCEQWISYRDNGRIISSNAKIDKELNEVLGLNNDNLVRARKYVIRTARERVQQFYKKKKKTKNWSKSDLVKEIKYWNSRKEDKYQEYCRIAIYYLEKKLSKL